MYYSFSKRDTAKTQPLGDSDSDSHLWVLEDVFRYKCHVLLVTGMHINYTVH